MKASNPSIHSMYAGSMVIDVFTLPMRILRIGDGTMFATNITTTAQ
jgi:hypothetical protein